MSHRRSHHRAIRKLSARDARLERLEQRLVFSLNGGLLSHDFQTSPIRDDYAVVAKNDAGEVISITSNDSLWPQKRIIGTTESNDDSRPSIEIVETGSGSVIVNQDDGTVTYKPAETFTGIDRFVYRLTKGTETHDANVYVNVVEPIYALRDWFRVDEDSQNNLIDVLANDGVNASEFKTSEFELRIVSISDGDADGTIELSADGKQLIYTPADGFQGLETFRYIAEDQNGNQSETEVRLQVTTIDGLQDTPVWTEEIEQELLESAVDSNRWRFGNSTEFYLYPRYYDWENRPRLDQFIGIDASAQVFTATSNADALTSLTVGGAETTRAVGDAGNFSNTNTRDARVDEGDVVKTDGEYLFVISNWGDSTETPNYQLVITDVRNLGAPSVVARYALDGPVSEMYLMDDRVALLSHEDTLATVTVLDVSDRSNPEMVYESKFNGALTQTRAVGDHIYVVSSSSVGQVSPAIETVCFQEDVGCFNETASQYVQRASILISDGIHPKVETTLSDGTVVSERSQWAMAPSVDEIRYSDLSAILSFDVMADGSNGPSDAKTIIQDANNEIYVSPEAIYFFENKHKAVDDSQNSMVRTDVWSEWWISPWGRTELVSNIEKISFDDDGQMQWSAAGQVPGHIQDGFSVHEHNGYLRMVTESANSSNLFVLEENAGSLDIVGSVEGLAPNEQIYSSRFEGDRGFLVTFRKVDPLFVFDLSDPTDPKVTGELKVTGYSNYLQLIDENTLLGIGREANDQGLFQEMQISLFDISDLDNPTLKHRYSFEGGRDLWSPLMQDAWNIGSHQSVSYFGSHQTLIMPIYEGNGRFWSWTGDGQDVDVSMRVLDIDAENGISELGTIDFADPFDPGSARAVRIGDALLSISPDLILAHELRSPDTKISEIRVGAGATDDVAVTRGATPMEIDVTANDVVAEGEFITKMDVTQPVAGGTVEITDDGMARFLPDEGFTGNVDFSYSFTTNRGLEEQASVKVEVKRAWHNTNSPMDVNGDGQVNGKDLLHIANAINEFGAGSIDRLDQVSDVQEGSNDLNAFDFQVDVNNDALFTAVDFLRLINHFADNADRNADSVAASNSNVQSLPISKPEAEDVDEFLSSDEEFLF